MSLPRLGVTLYSFTPCFHARRYSFEDLIRVAGERNLGPGLEVVGFQSIKNFPVLPDGFAAHFRRLVEDSGLELSCLGANADAGLRQDRLLTEDELVEYMRAQLEAAHSLGFPTVRVQHSVTADLMERLLPHAERLNLTLGMEIHSPHGVHHPKMQALLERFEKLSSPRLGFIPDWGASLTQLPPSLLETYATKGVSIQLLDAFRDQWNAFHREPLIRDDAEQGARFQRMREINDMFGGDDISVRIGTNSVGLFGHMNPEDWREIMPWVVHVHGKFYDIDADGNEPSIPHEILLRDLVAAGYDRYISTEWEGWHWNDTDDPFEMVAAQHQLSERILARLAAA
ncbi:sugar phosphate isomerase/epimerase [Nocardia sp. XZ_19_385]|uniref:sugar phosphate isomerase/epimerase family protein n=1 Tax=Nocardia sp. XZ_19_385 TaxID=2769488 RepID=UPI00188FCE39|nr:TIM barrel protein [Nocardia sp. XZ_19_385]